MNRVSENNHGRVCVIRLKSLQWRHVNHYGVSNHRLQGYLYWNLFRLTPKKISHPALLHGLLWWASEVDRISMSWRHHDCWWHVPCLHPWHQGICCHHLTDHTHARMRPPTHARYRIDRENDVHGGIYRSSVTAENVINTLRPRQNGRQFPDNFKCIFLIENEFRLRFHRSLFPRVKLTIFQHWFPWCIGAKPLSKPVMA